MHLIREVFDLKYLIQFMHGEIGYSAWLRHVLFAVRPFRSNPRARCPLQHSRLPTDEVWKHPTLTWSKFRNMGSSSNLSVPGRRAVVVVTVYFGVDVRPNSVEVLPRKERVCWTPKSFRVIGVTSRRQTGKFIRRFRTWCLVHCFRLQAYMESFTTYLSSI